jgi:hypothetical protein
VSISFLNKFAYTNLGTTPPHQIKDGKSIWSVVDLKFILVGLKSDVAPVATWSNTPAKLQLEYLTIPAKGGFETPVQSLLQFCNCTSTDIPEDNPSYYSMGVISGVVVDLRTVSWILQRLLEHRIENTYVWGTSPRGVPSIGFEWNSGKRRVFLGGLDQEVSEGLTVYQPPKSELSSILELAMMEED